MSLNRFNTFTPRDYNMEWFTPKEVMPNFEAWGAILGSQQQRYDQFNLTLDEKKPRYLQTEEDRKLFQDYSSLADNAKQSITDLYTQQGVSAGNRGMKEYSQKLSDEWKPGGKAAVLEDRYTAYVEAQKQIEETFKNDTNPANKWFAYKQLKDQLNTPINYDPKTGQYTRIQTPELYKDANILKSINEAIKEIKENGDTSIVRMSPYWLQKIKTEGRTAETLRGVTEALLQQPEFARQRDIEAAYKMSNTDPIKLKEQYAQNLNNQYLELEKTISTVKDVKKLQDELIGLGYDIKKTGKLDEQTRKASQEYLAKQSKLIKDQIDNFDPNEYGKQLVNKSYLDYASKFANQKRDIDLISDKAALVMLKIKAQKENTQALLSGIAELKNPKTPTELATPGKGINIDSFMKMKEQASTTLNSTKSQVNKLISSTPLGDNMNHVSSYINAWQQSGGDPVKFKQLIRQNPDFSLSGQNDEKLNDIAGYLSSSAGPAINQAFNAYQQASLTKSAIDQNDLSLVKTYVEKDGKDKFEKLKERYKRPGETDEDFMQSIVDKEPRFKNGWQNDAEMFLYERDKVVKSNKNGDYVKSINTYTITSTKESKALGPLKSLVEMDIKNNDVYGYMSEGTNGIVWRDDKGNNVTASVNNVKDLNMEINVLGTTGTGYNFSGMAKKGDKDINVHATVEKVPVTHHDAVRQSLLSIKANAINSKDYNLSDITTMGLAALDNRIDYTKVASQNTLRLGKNNTEPLDIVMPTLDAKGNITGVKNNSERNNPNIRGTKLETIEANGQTYNKYKVYNPNSSDGERFIYTQVLYKEGKPTIEVQMPGSKGQMYFNTSDAVEFDIYAKEYQSQLPTEMNINKVPSGEVNPDRLNALIQQFKQINN